MECDNSGSILSAIFGTIAVIAILALLLWWLYKKYVLKQQQKDHDKKLVACEDPENAKHEFAYDNMVFKGDEKTSTLNSNWTSSKYNLPPNKRKPLDDSFVQETASRTVSLKGSDFTGLGIECYGGLKDGIFVKKVAPQGPATGHINIGDRIMSMTIDFRHIVQEDAMTLLSYASPYNVQLELVNGNRSTDSGELGNSKNAGRQSPLIHPLIRSSSQTDLNTIERNSRKKLFQDESEMGADNSTTRAKSPPNVEVVNEKKSSSLMRQFRDQIAKIEEKFQTKLHANRTQNDAATEDILKNADLTQQLAGETSIEEDKQQQKKGPKFGIRVFPSSDEIKVEKASKNQLNDGTKMGDDVKIDIDGIKTQVETQVTIECENFVRQGSVNCSGIKRDVNGIPQELPNFMENAANAARSGRKMNDSKSKGKAPIPPADSMMENAISSESEPETMKHVDECDSTEIEDELKRITDKYATMQEDAKIAINVSGGEEAKSSSGSSDMEDQSNNNSNENDESRRAASLGDLSLMKKSLTEFDSGNSNMLERAQSLDITETNIAPKQSLAMALSKPTADLTDMKEPLSIYLETKSTASKDLNERIENENENVDEEKKELNGYSMGDNNNIIRYQFNSLEREPKSDVLKKILGMHNNEGNATTVPAPATNGEEQIKNNLKSIVTLNPTDMLTLDTEQPPVSLIMVNNTIDFNHVDPHQMSPVFSSDNFSIKISTIDPSSVIPAAPSTVKIENNFKENYMKHNVVTISTESQPSSIQFVDDVNLNFNMQTFNDECDDNEVSKLETNETMDKKMIGIEVNNNNHNNITKTTLNNDSENTIEDMTIMHLNKYISELEFKSEDSAIDDMSTSEEAATLTTSTMSDASSESAPKSNTKTLSLTNIPMLVTSSESVENYVEENFVPQDAEIKFTSTITHTPKEPAKRLSQIEQIRQNFEKSATDSPAAPIPVARRSSIPLNVNKSPSKIPVFSKKTSPTNRAKIHSSTENIG